MFAGVAIRRLWIGCVLLLSLVSVNAGASGLFKPGAYLSVKGQQHAMRVGSTRFTLPSAALAGGYWFEPGIALELELGTSLSEETRNGVDLEMDQLLSLGVRLEAPPTDELALYFVFSLNAAELSSRFTEIEPQSVGSSLQGYGVTFGATWQTALAGLVVDAGATHTRFESNLGINTLHIGLRYTLGVQR